ncbi:hypothetical protein ACRAWF_40035 [Streptomyces sp. L7]
MSPEPAYLDAGGGAPNGFQNAAEWWAYNGWLGRPKAAALAGLLCVRLAW